VQTIERALNAHAGGVLRERKSRADFRIRTIFEKAKERGCRLGATTRRAGAIRCGPQRRDLADRDRHSCESLLFAMPSPPLVARGVGCSVVGACVESPGQAGVATQGRRFFREIAENFLCDILREMRIPSELTQSGEVHRAHVTSDQFRKRRFGPIVHITSKQFIVSHSGMVQPITSNPREIAHKICMCFRAAAAANGLRDARKSHRSRAFPGPLARPAKLNSELRWLGAITGFGDIAAPVAPAYLKHSSTTHRKSP
jgi:hypothetical protein